MLTDLQLCNRALIKIGVEPIDNFYDDGLSNDLCFYLFDTIKEIARFTYNWSFGYNSSRPYFEQYLVCKLAAEMCFPLTGDINRANYLSQEANADLLKAIELDGRVNEGVLQ